MKHTIEKIMYVSRNAEKGKQSITFLKLRGIVALQSYVSFTTTVQQEVITCTSPWTFHSPICRAPSKSSDTKLNFCAEQL